MQAVLSIEGLPANALEAASTFYREHMDTITRQLTDEIQALVIALPSAAHDHDDWRRAVARDLARAHAPKRVNVIGASDGEPRSALIAYLEGAPGITGQYLAAHE